MQFDCRYLELWNACIFRLVYIIVLNVGDGMESEYPSIVFLTIIYLSVVGDGKESEYPSTVFFLV